MTSTISNPLPAVQRDASVIGLVALAHGVSHFCQLLLPPLFPWLKDAFAVSYAQLGLLLTIFFVVSCAVQTAAGFVVDRLHPAARTAVHHQQDEGDRNGFGAV